MTSVRLFILIREERIPDQVGEDGKMLVGGKKKIPDNIFQYHPVSRSAAAAYSPTWWGSTIGASGLNCSVRDGKRCLPAAIAAAISCAIGHHSLQD